MENVVIIDSGIGGLTVYNHLIELNVNTHVTYLADNRFFPYGTKNDNELKIIIERILNYFTYHNYKHLFLACNTASVIYNKYFINKYPVNVYPIIENTVDEILKLPYCKKIGVIGTNKTIEECVYQNRIKQLVDVEVIAIPCSDLVMLCEKYDEDKIREYINKYFMIFKEKQIDTLILGCTHFNVISKILDEYFEHNIKIICSGYALIESLNNSVLTNNINNNCSIYVTNRKHNYNEIVNVLFPKLKNKKIEYLEL
ncbi:MAG: murI [Haloplasmataceae bacterium]|nr:murI [Haloplasmataceae bacterium]